MPALPLTYQLIEFGKRMEINPRSIGALQRATPNPPLIWLLLCPERQEIGVGSEMMGNGGIYACHRWQYRGLVSRNRRMGWMEKRTIPTKIRGYVSTRR